MPISAAAAEPGSHDAAPRARLVSPSGIMAVRSALQAHLRSSSDQGALRWAVRLLCAEAHREQLRAEHLIVAIKEAWQTIPEAQHNASAHDRQLLDRAITMCIEEFYASGGAGGR